MSVEEIEALDSTLPSGEHQDGEKSERKSPVYKVRPILPRDIDHIMRKPEVCTVTGLSGPSIDRLEEAGEFPRRMELGSGKKWKPIGWFSQEVWDWVDSRLAARDPS